VLSQGLAAVALVGARMPASAIESANTTLIIEGMIVLYRSNDNGIFFPR
jgi:hypothetical protein